MAKLIAILNVIAWSGFWAFGYLALTTSTEQTGQMMTALILAVVGGAVGMIAFFWLARHAEDIGYAKPRNRAVPEHLRPPVDTPDA